MRGWKGHRTYTSSSLAQAIRDRSEPPGISGSRSPNVHTATSHTRSCRLKETCTQADSKFSIVLLCECYLSPEFVGDWHDSDVRRQSTDDACGATILILTGLRFSLSSLIFLHPLSDFHQDYWLKSSAGELSDKERDYCQGTRLNEVSLV